MGGLQFLDEVGGDSQIAGAAGTKLDAGFDVAVEIGAAGHEEAIFFGEVEEEIGVAGTMVAVISLDGVEPGFAELRHKGGNVAPDAGRMGERSDSPDAPDP